MAGKHIEDAKAYNSELYTNIKDPEKRSETLASLKQRAQQSVDQIRNSNLGQTVKDSTSKGLASLEKMTRQTGVNESTPLNGKQLPFGINTSRNKRAVGETIDSLNNKKEQLQNNLAGGKGLSKNRRHKGKWRTQKLRR